MNVFTSAWRSSLAATAMWTALGGGSRLPADEPLREETVQASSESTQSANRDTPRDQDRVREVLEAIRQQVEQFKKEGNRDAAERLVQVAETMNRKFGGTRSTAGQRSSRRVSSESSERRVSRPKSSPRRESANRPRSSCKKPKRWPEHTIDRRGDERSENVERKLKAVREHAGKLAKEGKGEQAEKLMQEAEAMARKSQEDARFQQTEQSEAVKQKLKAVTERLAQLRKQGDIGAAERLVREAEPRTHEVDERVRALRADRQRRAEVERRLRKQGDHETADKVMREADARARKYKEQLDSPRPDSSDDVRKPTPASTRSPGAARAIQTTPGTTRRQSEPRHRAKISCPNCRLSLREGTSFRRTKGDSCFGAAAKAVA